MNQEDKELLLKDLCARLPYGVKCKLIYNNHSEDATLFGIDKYAHFLFAEFGEDVRKFVCKPYLFPLSSMTEEQIEEAKTYFWKDVDYGKSLVDKGINCFYPCFNILEFYHKNHLDYRGLIPMGLAIDATGLNIY